MLLKESVEFVMEILKRMKFKFYHTYKIDGYIQFQENQDDLSDQLGRSLFLSKTGRASIDQDKAIGIDCLISQQSHI